jgi:hypothetical protein
MVLGEVERWCTPGMDERVPARVNSAVEREAGAMDPALLAPSPTGLVERPRVGRLPREDPGMEADAARTIPAVRAAPQKMRVIRRPARPEVEVPAARSEKEVMVPLE